MVAALLGALGAAVFYPHVRGGGFYSDDWASAATYHFAAPPRFVHALAAYGRTFGTRPLLDVAKAAGYAILGLHTAWHLALAVLLGVLVSLVLYGLLRRFRLAPAPALLVAGLVLVFPWSDSTRLWATASLNQLATVFYLLGLSVALAGLERSGRRALLLHGAALTLYAAGLLVYEAVGGLVLISGALYWVHVRGSWRRIGSRWAADVCLAAGVLLWSASSATAARAAPSVHQIIHDLPRFVHQALSLALHALAPGLPVLVPLAVAAGAAIAGVIRWRRGALVLDGGVGWWLAVAGVAALASGAAFAPLVGSGLHPLDQGLNNRGNVAAALPVCLFVAAAISAAVRVVAPERRACWWGLAALVAIGFGYCDLTREDIGRWDRATQLQHQVLSSLRSALPRPSRGEVAYTYGVPALVAPGVSVFSEFWDLSGAFRLQAGEVRLGAYALVQGVSFVCGARGVYPSAGPGPYDALQGGYGPAEGADYGRAFLVDVVTRRATAITGARQCRAVTAHLALEPLVGRATG